MLTELFIGPGVTFQSVYLRTKISQPEWLHSLGMHEAYNYIDKFEKKMVECKRVADQRGGEMGQRIF
jgi:hypothetical protein